MSGGRKTRKGKTAGWLRWLRRTLEGPHQGEIYATECLGCGSIWKVYAQSGHPDDCPWVQKIPYNDELAQKLAKERAKEERQRKRKNRKPH